MESEGRWGEGRCLLTAVPRKIAVRVVRKLGALNAAAIVRAEEGDGEGGGEGGLLDVGDYLNGLLGRVLYGALRAARGRAEAFRRPNKRAHRQK